MSKKILVIEDEPAISMAIRDELAFEGYTVDVTDNGDIGLQRILENRPDLVVLDLMLPGMSGFEICREVRKEGLKTPIIILTARTREADRVRGLDLGADDYLVKPFSLAELLARVRAVLRRAGSKGQGVGDSGPLRVGDLEVDPRRHKVLKGRLEVDVTPIEFQLLELLLRRPGEVIGRDEFLNQIWGERVYVTPRVVDTHMAALRKKIENDSNKPSYIISVHGVGYKLNETLTET